MDKDKPVKITCSGFMVDDPSLDPDELADVARELASNIGSRLADLGRGSKHGEVIIEVGGVEGVSS